MSLCGAIGICTPYIGDARSKPVRHPRKHVLHTAHPPEFDRHKIHTRTHTPWSNSLGPRGIIGILSLMLSTYVRRFRGIPQKNNVDRCKMRPKPSAFAIPQTASDCYNARARVELLENDSIRTNQSMVDQGSGSDDRKPRERRYTHTHGPGTG
jgi:hypothetical protein